MRKAPPRYYKLEPPIARIIDSRPAFDEALHNFTIFAVRSYYNRKTSAKYVHDFEVRNGLLRGSRIPIGKGVAIDAYSIRWIVTISRRTLLTSESLNGFP